MRRLFRQCETRLRLQQLTVSHPLRTHPAVSGQAARRFARGDGGGFTLVELAIAIVIVGLLIGGIIKGAAMIESAQEKRLITVIQEIRTATLLFRDHHGAMPGDMADAMERLPGCTAAALCENGDGNGLVASDGSDQYDWLSPLVGTGIEHEAVQAWKHLALADLITGVEPSGDPNVSSWGLTRPRSLLGGGFEFYYDAYVGAGGRPGHTLRLSENGLSAAVAFGEPVRGALTPRQSAALDIMIDDGNPATGDVVADYGTPLDECKDTAGAAALYRESDDAAACILYIHVSP